MQIIGSTKQAEACSAEPGPTKMGHHKRTKKISDHATTVTVGRILCYAKRCGLTLETRFCRFVRSFLLHWRKQFVLSHLGSQHDATRISCWAPTPAAIAEHSAANPPAAVAAVDRRERRTDGRTPDRYIDPARHSVRLATLWSHVCLCT